MSYSEGNPQTNYPPSIVFFPYIQLANGYLPLSLVINIILSHIGLTFLRPTRTHVKENIFHPDEDNPLRYTVNVPFTTLCVLTGTELSTEESLKIDKTFLADLIQEEGQKKGKSDNNNLEQVMDTVDTYILCDQLSTLPTDLLNEFLFPSNL